MNIVLTCVDAWVEFHEQDGRLQLVVTGGSDRIRAVVYLSRKNVVEMSQILALPWELK